MLEVAVLWEEIDAATAMWRCKLVANYDLLVGREELDCRHR